MTFLDSIGDAFGSAWSWSKGAASDIYNDGVKPGWNKITDVTGKLIDAGERFGENTLTNISNIQGLISNPFVIIAVIIGAVIIVPPILGKM